MPIIRPMLPPKEGYVEVEVNGVRTYRNVKTGLLIGDEIPPDPPITWDAIAAAITEGVNEV